MEEKYFCILFSVLSLCPNCSSFIVLTPCITCARFRLCARPCLPDCHVAGGSFRTIEENRAGIKHIAGEEKTIFHVEQGDRVGCMSWCGYDPQDTSAEINLIAIMQAMRDMERPGGIGSKVPRRDSVAGRGQSFGRKASPRQREDAFFSNAIYFLVNCHRPVSLLGLPASLADTRRISSSDRRSAHL